MSDIAAEAYQRAMRLTRMGAHEAAIEAWRDVLTEDPLDADAHAMLAHNLMLRGRMVGARAEAMRALELDAENGEALTTLALCDFAENRRKSALARLDEALALDALDTSAMTLRVQLLRDAGRFDDARAALEELLRIAPFHREARIERAQLALRGGHRGEAHDIAAQLVADDPEFVPALVLLGELARDAGDVGEAHRLALSALSVDATDPAALDLLASVKLSRNPLGGMFWHLARLLSRMGERRVLIAMWFVYLGYMMVNSTLAWAGVNEAVRLLFVLAYLGLFLGLYLNRSMIDRMVRKELATFRIRPDY